MADTTAQTIDLRGYWILDCRDPDDDWRRYVADLFATEDGSTLLALRDDRCGPYSTNPEFDREVGAWVVATEDGFRSELVRGWRIEADHPRLINRSGPEPDWSFVQDYWQRRAREMPWATRERTRQRFFDSAGKRGKLVDTLAVRGK